MFCHFCGKEFSFNQWYELEGSHPMCSKCYKNEDKPVISKEEEPRIESRLEILDIK